MLKTQEYQPDTVKFYASNCEMRCSVCGEDIVSVRLPTYCEKCNTRFEWKITAFYEEEALQAKNEDDPR